MSSVIPTTLTAAEEHALIARYRSGDRRAGDRLLLAHHAFIDYWRQRLRGRLDVDDVAQEARLAILEAADLWEDRGARLATFAMAVVIRRLGADKDHKRAWRAKRKGQQVPPWKRPPTSLDAPYDDGRTVGETLPSEDDDPSIACETVAVLEAARRAMAQLAERDQDILHRLYLADENVTLEAVGDLYGVSKSAIQQRRDRALLTIRRAIETPPFHGSAATLDR